MRALVARAGAWLDSPNGMAVRRVAILVIGVQCIRVTLENTEDRLTTLEKGMGKVTGWVPHDDIATLADLDKVARGEWAVTPAAADTETENADPHLEEGQQE